MKRLLQFTCLALLLPLLAPGCCCPRTACCPCPSAGSSWLATASAVRGTSGATPIEVRGTFSSRKGKGAILSSDQAVLRQVAAKRAGRPSTLSEVKPLSAGAADQKQTPMIALAVEFRDEAAQRAFRPREIHVYSRFERFADVFVPLDGREEERLAEVTKAPGYVRVEDLGAVPLPPGPPGTRSSGASRGQAEKIVQGGYRGRTGKGVVVAVIDTGLDFRHPDFVRMEAGKPVSRVLALWDPNSSLHAQGIGKPGPVTYPNGAPVGTVFRREDLTAELRSGKNRIPASDPGGHGTSCAGIAAGSGAASDGLYPGVAPDADVVAVRISDAGGDELSNAYLFGAALDWLHEVAGERPLVVSCSWGSLEGLMDGSSVVEERVNARFKPSAKGRAICIAAGNNGGSGLHAGFSVKSETAVERLTVEALPDHADAVACQVRVCIRNGAVAEEEWHVDADGGLAVDESAMHSVPGSRDVVLEVALAGTKGDVWFWTTSGTAYEADAYLADARFTAEIADEERLVASPGAALAAITVGSYDWNDNFTTPAGTGSIAIDDKPMRIGALSSYSSPGPRRGDNQKPDLVAPGQWFSAPLSASQPTEGLIVDATGKYLAFNGTSAATPYTAGIVALLLEREPALTSGEIQRRLRAAARTDEFTGRTPSGKAGAGKLNMEAIQILFQGSAR